MVAPARAAPWVWGETASEVLDAGDAGAGDVGPEALAPALGEPAEFNVEEELPVTPEAATPVLVDALVAPPEPAVLPEWVDAAVEADPDAAEDGSELAARAPAAAEDGPDDEEDERSEAIFTPKMRSTSSLPAYKRRTCPPACTCSKAPASPALENAQIGHRAGTGHSATGGWMTMAPSCT